jgi:hypothetical protein
LRPLGEGVARPPLTDAATPLGDEERRSERCRKDAISGLGVILQSVYRGGMNRHVTRFSKLRPPDVKNSAIEVDILSVQTQGFVDPHSRRHQQTKKSRIGASAESPGRRELSGPAKEPFDLLVAIDMRQLAPVAMREQSGGWNLGARFERAQPEGEASDHP